MLLYIICSFKNNIVARKYVCIIYQKPQRIPKTSTEKKPK